MIKEQSSDWFLFDDKSIIKDLKYRNPQNLDTNKLERPLGYCNLPLANFNEDENFLGKKWKLKYLFVFVRHGQRASVNSMLDTDYRYRINCSLRQFPSFKIHDWKEFINSLDKSNIHFKNFDMKGVCKESQLTLLGILQMFILSSRLKTLYKQFIKSSSLAIYSTPYQRTLLSSEIIQYHLMKDITKNQNASKIQESQSLVFCRSTANISCQCPSLRYFFAKYNRYLSTKESENKKCLKLIKDFHSIFNDNRNHNSDKDHSITSLSNLFDIISSTLCASNIEGITNTDDFCWPIKDGIINQESWSFLYKIVDEAKQDSDKLLKQKKKITKSSDRCLPLQFITDLWTCFDDITETINNYPYFRKYSKLAVYPILKDIVSRVTNQISTFVDSNNLLIENKHPNLVVYVGHDYTIRYLLSALDFNKAISKSIYDTINQWPGFASRLVIEVFEQKADKHSENPLKFRLLYEGLDITSILSFCQTDEIACDFQLLSNYLSSDGFWNKDMFSNNQYSEQCKTT